MSLPSAFPVGLTVCEVTGQQENCMNTHGNMCHILGFCRELSLQRSLRCRINEHKISFFIECHPFWRYCISLSHMRVDVRLYCIFSVNTTLFIAVAFLFMNVSIFVLDIFLSGAVGNYQQNFSLFPDVQVQNINTFYLLTHQTHFHN